LGKSIRAGDAKASAKSDYDGANWGGAWFEVFTRRIGKLRDYCSLYEANKKPN